MPILSREDDLFPSNLLASGDGDHSWSAVYTLARQEKSLMRWLRDHQTAHYCPLFEHRYRSPAGRVRTSYLPLFPGYVFLCGDEGSRRIALQSNCCSRILPVDDPAALVVDLQQIHRLLQTGVPVTAVERLQAGDRIRVKNGPFMGFEGMVIQRDQQHWLQVAVHFMNQGAIVKLDDCQLEKLS
jgi:transcriptional antiterminator RfaH